MLRARTCTVQWTYILRTVHRRRLAIHGVHHTRESYKGQGGPEGTKGEREHRAYPPPRRLSVKYPTCVVWLWRPSLLGRVLEAGSTHRASMYVDHTGEKSKAQFSWTSSHMDVTHG